MDIIKVKPADGGKKSEVTIEMTAEEAELFKQALAAGKLAHLGITAGSVVEIGPAHRGKTKWTTSEDEKRTKPKDGPDPTRRP